ncbi:thiol reductant ABC exporter subunit CydC [Leucobacter tardus]|uniref:ABC transporter ATP-binding protein n=1 Tax=Leucobacter tardus TaxID=501483 RepID=A0A939QFF9_9MICO|nr:ABC transporter ATP-binding protein [Leucobacter tardus]MBO2989183.1 ABC transporter ATP-binding protein [Leucobacter tardus]
MSTTAPVTSRRTLTAWLFSHTRSLLPMLGASAIARIVGNLLNVAILVVAAQALLDVASGVPVSLMTLALIVVALAAVKAALRYLEQFTGHWVAFTALQRLRVLFFERLVPQAPAATSGRASAELTERATRDIDRIEVFFAHTFPPVIASVAVPAITLVWLGVSGDPLLAGIIAVFLALALLLPFVSAGATWRASRGIAADRGRVATHVADDVQGVREVLAFEAERSRLASLGDADASLAAAQRGLARVVGARIAIEQALRAACLVLLLLSGRPVADIVLAVAVLFGLWFKNAGTDDFATGLDAAFAACDRVRSVIEAPPAVADTGALEVPGSGGPEIEFAGVSFAYPGTGSSALADISTRFAAGEWHAIVGVSGSGKSTVAALLTRSWDPDAGEISVAGVPVPELSLDALRRTVALVDQRPTLFPGSLASNLRLARPDATDAALEAALHDVCLGADSLPEGLDTEVGERGTTLSGGQLQRVALARALVSEPRILILDEALSQLDADTARSVRSRIAERFRLDDGGTAAGPTVIEITHRADEVAADGRVSVIDRGALVESGVAGDLLDRHGPFSRLALRDA